MQALYERIPVSVCMAAYNGIKYIQQQIDSILPQLDSCDELLISDDGSTDGTWEFICDLAKKDDRVKVMKGPRAGANQNFFSLLDNAKNEIIFISDQDDIWFEDKIEKVCKVFSDNVAAEVVLHKDIIVFTKSNKQVNCVPMRHGILNNLLRNSYSGHRLAIRQSFKKKMLMDKTKCPAYDQYIGLLAEKHRCGFFLDEILDYHLMHGDNVSRPLSLKNKLIIRMKLLACLLYK